MKKRLTLMSLFDGSGGFTLSAKLCGIEPIAASEIAPFPIRVTTKRLPQVTHLGDVRYINGADVLPVDIITFGSPCTDLSVAGRREGLKGKQSSLFYEAIRIIKEMRCATNGKYPRFAVYENVLGAFSSSKGEDFRLILEAFTSVKDENLHVPLPETGKWLYAGEAVGDGFSIVWRTLNAEYFGVAQRRRRVYLVADFDGERASEILFEFESMSGNPPSSSIKGKDTSCGAERSTGATGRLVLNDQGGERIDITDGVTATLRAEAHHPPCVISIENHPSDGRIRIREDEKSQALTMRMGTGGMNCPLIAYGICSDGSNAMLSPNPMSGIYEAETSRTLDGNGGNPSCNQGGMAILAYSLQGSMIGRSDENGPNGDGINEGISFTLNTVDKHAVAYGIDRSAFNQGANALYNPVIEEEQPTMTAKGPGAVAVPAYLLSKASFFTSAERECANTLVATDYKEPPMVNVARGTEYIVRRLTPSECALLQGFPPWWCEGLETPEPSDAEIEWWSEVFEIYRRAIGKSKKPKSRNQIVKWLRNPHSDSQEYSMWGNGICLQCGQFVLAGIAHFA